MDNALIVRNVRGQFAETPWENWSWPPWGRRGPCLGIALDRAGEELDIRLAAWSEVASIILREFPERISGDATSCFDSMGVIVAFNDHPLTTRSDIDLILDKFAAS